METFYNVVNAIVCRAKEARASIVLDIKWMQFVLRNCEKLQNYWFNLNKAEKNKFFRGLYDKKTAPHSTAYLRHDEKRIFKRLVYTPPDLTPGFTCKVNLSNIKNPA